jgi:hypothetical protein
MAPNVFAKYYLGIIRKAPSQVDDCVASLDRILNALSIVQVPLQILNGAFELSPFRRPVENPDFISLSGKILGQMPSDFSPTSGNQDAHRLFPSPPF